MAIFKVGQRVKKIALAPRGSNGIPVNSAGTIVSVNWIAPTGGVYQYCVQYDGNPFLAGADACWIAPLTDPHADAFIERIKKLQPLKEPSHV